MFGNLVKKPIVVINLAVADPSFIFNEHIGRFIGIWANYMALPFIEAVSKQLDNIHEGAILEFVELRD